MRPTQIEQTAKRYKGSQAIGVLSILAGTAAAVSGIAANKDFHGGEMLIFGITLYIGGRVLAWWNHG